MEFNNLNLLRMQSQKSVHVDRNCAAMVQETNVTKRDIVAQIIYVDNADYFNPHKVGLFQMVEPAHNRTNAFSGFKAGTTK
jgi:hypothetical protein